MPEILLGSADQEDHTARLIAGPHDPQLVVDRELERLQPALAADEDDRHDDQMRADQRFEDITAQYTNELVSSGYSHRVSRSAWSAAPWSAAGHCFPRSCRLRFAGGD